MLISRVSVKVDLVESFVSSRMFSKLYKKKKKLLILVELNFNKFVYRQRPVRASYALLLAYIRTNNKAKSCSHFVLS